MARHNDLGKQGEALAAEYLMINGHQILFRNWRHSHYEIDIISCKEAILHFIEVKARTGIAFGFPEESVGNKKIDNLMRAGEEFLFQFPEWKRVQYDVLSILISKNNIDYYLIEDVYL
jgi:putative endonuclease